MVKYMQIDVDSLHNSMNSLLTREYYFFLFLSIFFMKKSKSCLYHALQTTTACLWTAWRNERRMSICYHFHFMKREQKNIKIKIFHTHKWQKGENFALNIYEGAHAEINFCRSSKTDDSSPFLYFLKAWIFTSFYNHSSRRQFITD